MKYLVNSVIFDTLEEAEVYIASIGTVTIDTVGKLYVVRNGYEEYRLTKKEQVDAKVAELAKKVYPTPIVTLLGNEDKTTTFYKAKDFGRVLLDTFLIDNWNTPIISFTEDISNKLLAKFLTVKQLAEVGDIRTIGEILPFIEVDEIFTQERKDKYLQMVSDFVSENYDKRK